MNPHDDDPRSPDLEQLYQQFSFAPRRTSLVVTNMIDILARVLVLLLTWPSGWWGVVCNWLAGLSMVMWVGICVLALTRKEVMTSPQWLRWDWRGSKMEAFQYLKGCLKGSVCLSVCVQVPVAGKLVLPDHPDLCGRVQLGGE